MIKKILVPTDGSERAEAAAGFATELAKSTGAELIFLYVVDEISPAFAYELESGASLDIGELEEQRKKYGHVVVERLKKQADEAGVGSSRVLVEEGHPWEEILAVVDRESVDHIIMGSHGRRALAAAVLGNVTFNVIHGARVPVTVIPRVSVPEA